MRDSKESNTALAVCTLYCIYYILIEYRETYDSLMIFLPEMMMSVLFADVANQISF